MEDSDAQLHLKKRARRRLVGAVAFVALVAVVLPMIMDSEPKPVLQDVEIRIPNQDEKPFAPRFGAAPASAPVEKAEPAPVPVEPDQAPTARLLDKPQEKAAITDKSQDKSVEKPPVAAKPEKPVEKPAEKAAPSKPAEKTAEKPADKPVAKESGDNEGKRAAAILAGKAPEPAARGGEQVILIGAFANEANVKTLRNKLGELGIKAYTEPLDSPQGKKTRVRAGPFPNREAAEKALERMKRIGVSGVIAAK